MIRVHVRAKPGRMLQLYYVDPNSGKDVTKSARTTNWKEAERKAALWQAELERTTKTENLSWPDFEDAVDREFLAHRPKATRQPYERAMDVLAETMGEPKRINAINGAFMSKLAGKLHGTVEPVTIGKHLRHLRALFRWAESVGYMERAPVVIAPKVDRQERPTSRAFDEAAFKKILAKAPSGWKWLVEGLWLSGMRLSEALTLSWDSRPVRLSLEGHGHIDWSAEGQKSRRAELSPITPDFLEFCKALPHRSGTVFQSPTASRTSATKAITNICRLAGVDATAHDFRRSFATRWALVVPPVALQALMRHEQFATTLQFYADIKAKEVGEVIAKGYSVLRGVPPNGEKPNGTPLAKPKKRGRKPRE